MPNLVGIGNSQVPTNAMLGGLAYQDSSHVVIKEADITSIASIKAKKTGNASPQQTSATGGRTVFVYDTRKDSDGGAWRYRCSNLSWYNEGPSSIRGDRKIFPCVAVIVSYGTYVDIYDADQPECPLWMRFPDDTNSARNVMYGTGNVRCVYALNGVMVFGSNATNFWPVLVNFLTDEIIGVRTSGGHNEYGGGIADRDNATNDSSLWWSGNGRDSSKWWFQNCVIYSNLVYDAVMYVPPDAPIWEPMGLPAPSIIWGTASGVTIWEGTPARSHNASVMSSHKAPNLSKVNRLGQFCAVYNNNNPTYVKFFPALYGELDTNYYNHYDASVALGMSIQWDPQGAKAVWLGKTMNGWYDLLIYNDGGYGFNIYYGGGRDGAQTNCTRMMAQIHAKFNTGIQPPNCQLCVLATTTSDNYYQDSTSFGSNDSVTITGAELLTNPMPTSNVTGWTDNSGSGSSISYSSNGGGSIYLNGSTAYANATQAITTVVGQWYAFSVGAEGQTFSSNHNVHLLAGNSAPNGSTLNAHSSMICRPQDSGQSEEMPVVLQFQATATTTYISVHSGWPVYVRDMRLRKCDPDRMFRMDYTQHTQSGRGLPIYGTLTLKPVAPGAELLSYSGFSGSNYLGGLYTPNLNFSTTQQYISVWVKIDLDSGIGYIFARGTGDATESLRLGMRNDTIYFDYGDSQDYVQTSNGVSSGRWNHLFCYVKAGQKGEIFVNGIQQPYSNQKVGNTPFPNATNYNTTVGQQYGSGGFPGEIALLRIGGLIPSNDAIQRIYQEEWKMFQPNAKCTMQGYDSGVADDHSHVRAAEYDEDTDILHVGNVEGRSDFRGLVRINSHTDAINASIAASGGVIVES